MKFDRSKIAHVTNPKEGFALVNGCQGIFLNKIFWTFEDAERAWVENGGFEKGEDEQICRVRVEIIHDELCESDPFKRAAQEILES